MELVELSSSSQFEQAEEAIDLDIALCKSAASATSLQLLGFIRNRQAYPLRAYVQFFASEHFEVVARKEADGKGKVDLSMCASRAVSDEQYGDVVRDLLSKLKQADTRVVVGCIPSRAVDIWSSSLSELGISEASREDFVWYMNTVSPAPRPLPDNMHLGTLSHEDARLVSSHWPYCDMEGGGSSYVQNMINGFPSSCIRLISGQVAPVAWILTYPYGALGCLHVEEDYRRLGLGSFLVNQLCEKVSRGGKDSKRPRRVYAFVAKDNESSKGMFARLENWAPMDEGVKWIVAFRPAQG